MKNLIATAALAAAGTLLLVPSSAQATRIGTDFDFTKDVCWNVRGHQSIYDVTGARPEWRINLATPKRRHDCVKNNLGETRPF